jgi:hypothetical protein
MCVISYTLLEKKMNLSKETNHQEQIDFSSCFSNMKWNSKQFVNFYLTLLNLTETSILRKKMYDFLKWLNSTHNNHLAHNILNEFIAEGRYDIVEDIVNGNLDAKIFSDYKPVLYSFNIESMEHMNVIELLLEKKIRFIELTGDAISPEIVIKYIPYYEILLSAEQHLFCLFLLMNSKNVETECKFFAEIKKTINISFTEKIPEIKIDLDEKIAKENSISNHFWLQFVNRRYSVAKTQKDLATFLQTNPDLLDITILELMKMDFTIPLSVVVWFFQTYPEKMNELKNKIFERINAEILYIENISLIKSLLEFLYKHFSCL